LKLLTENRALVIRDINKVSKFITQAPKGVDSAPIYDRIKELQGSQKGIDIQIEQTKKQIDLIEQTTVSKKSFREEYSKVGNICSSLDNSGSKKDHSCIDDRS
jgi:hypothetical protein